MMQHGSFHTAYVGGEIAPPVHLPAISGSVGEAMGPLALTRAEAHLALGPDDDESPVGDPLNPEPVSPTGISFDGLGPGSNGQEVCL